MMRAVEVDSGKLAQSVLDSLLEGCQVIGFDFTYLYLNSTAAAQGGRVKDELLGRRMCDCYPGIEESGMFARLENAMHEREHSRMENEFTFPDGTTGWFELRFIPVPEGVCVLSIDITARKRGEAALARSEEQLRQAQKMEALGRLAGGIAHDFNNLLSVILSYAPLALERLSPEHPVRSDLCEIEKAGNRGKLLTTQLLAFSRQQPLELRALDVNDVLRGVNKLLRRVVREDIELRTIEGQSLDAVNADAGQLEQILLNLTLNACDAMPDGGRLTIETANVELDRCNADEHLGVGNGRHVMLAVSDTGTGMTKETQARIFEPFFTTKPEGRGTGLGLATVFGIVEKHGGSIWVYSEVGKGTTFKTYFPSFRRRA